MSYIENFTKRILASSNDNTYEEAIKEWISYGEEEEGEAQTCICGHGIKINCRVVNTINGNILTVGNCCIKKFGIEKKHFNGSKRKYITFCISKCTTPADVDYCNKVMDQIDKGYMFYASQLARLEQISGKSCRFKAFEDSKKSRRW